MKADVNGHLEHREQQVKSTVAEHAFLKRNSTNHGKIKVPIKEIYDRIGKERSRELRNHLEPRLACTRKESSRDNLYLRERGKESGLYPKSILGGLNEETNSTTRPD